MSNSIYQYTDLNAVQSIIKSNRVRATHFKFLNDYSEALHGIDLIIEQLAKDRDLHFVVYQSFKNRVYKVLDGLNIYVASFTDAEDRLSMWRGYGGYAIEFDKSAVTLGITVEGSSRSNNVVPCLYTDDCSKVPQLSGFEALNTLFDKFYDTDKEYILGRMIISNAVGIKNRGFFEEEEHRALIVLGDEDNLPVHHRISSNISVPYIELILPAESILGVMIGPNQDTRKARIGLESYLKANELEYIKVRESEITFRA